VEPPASVKSAASSSSTTNAKNNKNAAAHNAMAFGYANMDMDDDHMLHSSASLGLTNDPDQYKLNNPRGRNASSNGSAGPSSTGNAPPKKRVHRSFQQLLKKDQQSYIPPSLPLYQHGMGMLGGIPPHHMLSALPSPPNLSSILPSPTTSLLLRHEFSPQGGGMFGSHHYMMGQHDLGDKNGSLGLSLMPSDFGNGSQHKQQQQGYYMPPRGYSPMAIGKASSYRAGSPLESPHDVHRDHANNGVGRTRDHGPDHDHDRDHGEEKMPLHHDGKLESSKTTNREFGDDGRFLSRGPRLRPFHALC